MKKKISVRNPFVVSCKAMGHQVVKAKKGKGSFTRKQKHKRTYA